MRESLSFKQTSIHQLILHHNVRCTEDQVIDIPFAKFDVKPPSLESGAVIKKSQSQVEDHHDRPHCNK
jgi:hypothetical protein